MNSNWDVLFSIIQTLVIISVVAGALALGMFYWVYRDARRLNIPPEAGFFGTLRVMPLHIAVFLDLLDLALDVFAAPLSWAILRFLRLDHLRAPATIEALIPGTQYLPTMTVLWVAARALGLGDPKSWRQTQVRQTGWNGSTSTVDGDTTTIEGRVVSRPTSGQPAQTGQRLRLPRETQR